MKELIIHLNNHYNWALGETNSTEFYLHIRDYIDIILKNPELLSIISNESNSVKNKIIEINNDPLLNLNLKEESIDRLKLTGLYSDYVYLFSNVYSPIEDYNRGIKYHSHEAETNLYYISGIENVPENRRPSCAQFFITHKKKCEYRFINLHNKFIKLIDEKEPKNKLKFLFDPNTGYFKYKKTEGTLSPKSKEFKFLNCLWLSPSHQASYEELLNKEEKATSYDKNMLTEIIKSLKRKLNILPKNLNSNPDIIKSISKYGYKLSI